MLLGHTDSLAVVSYDCNTTGIQASSLCRAAAGLAAVLNALQAAK
jgi:hypothetical protein